MTPARAESARAAFKAYDIRGRVPEELDAALAFSLGRAFACLFEPDQVAVGWDVRPSSPALAEALIEGLMEGGVEVLELGLCGTEEVYFAVSHERLDGGIMITASHNPPEYNGMKLVGPGARPISQDSGLDQLRDLALTGAPPSGRPRGSRRTLALRPALLEFLLGQIDRARLAPATVLCDGGHGCVGPLLEELAPHLPVRLVLEGARPDGSFPRGVPNPLLPEQRAETSRAVLEAGAGLGAAWDGDFDRCFFFDERGRFIEGYYLVGLMAEAALKRAPGGRILHDPRLTWNTIELVERAGGVPVLCKTGHAFIKARMRQEDAVYGGEMSAHHYFREFAYCDSGILPWLKLMEWLGSTGRTLSELVDERMARFPVSGEINRRVDDAEATLARVMARYRPLALAEDRTDGISLELPEWRFNLRRSNTEPLIRLNVETRGLPDLLAEKTQEILALISEP